MKKIKRIKLKKPEKRNAILYARVKPQHIKTLKTQAKKNKMSLSEYTDYVLDSVQTA